MQVGLVANQALSSFKTYIYVCKTCIHATPQAPVSAQHELHIILRRPLRTDADTDADPRGEVFGPRYDSHMLTLVGVYQKVLVNRNVENQVGTSICEAAFFFSM